MNEQIQEYFSNAQTAFSSGQYETAFEWCEKAIAEDPSSADAYTGAGKACLVLNKLPESEQYFQKAAELDPENGEKYFNLGNIKFGLEKYTEALLNYAKAERYGCDDIIKQKLYYQIGMLNHMAGDAKAALLNFEKSESIGAVNADTKEILLKRLQIYIESQDYVSAENYAVQLKLLAPQEFRSYQIYFQILLTLEKYKKAEEILIEAEKYSDALTSGDIQDKRDVYFDKAILATIKAETDPENAKTHHQTALNILDDFTSVPDLTPEIINDISFSKAEIFLKLEKFDSAMDCINGIESDDEDTKEKINFIKLSCYIGKAEYENSIRVAEFVKQSKNEYYQYFAIYSDTYATRKLSEKDSNQEKNAQLKYDNAIAFFKKKTFENSLDMFALVFRIRLYAENAKFVKANELIGLLPENLKLELQKYVETCRA